jgi:hypothetical protein
MSAQILAVRIKQVERKETGFRPMPKKIAELWSSIVVKANDFSVENRRLHPERLSDFDCESGEGFERMLIPRNQLAPSIEEMSQSAEPTS